MATKDPNSRLTESDLNSPDYLQPNGATGQRGNGGATVSGVRAQPDPVPACAPTRRRARR